jgi:hypothetical protein
MTVPATVTWLSWWILSVTGHASLRGLDDCAGHDVAVVDNEFDHAQWLAWSPRS